MAGVIIPKFHGRFTITASSNNFTINEAAAGDRTITLDLADFFIRGYTAEGTESGHTDAGQLAEHIQARVRAAGPGAELDTFTCTVSDAGFVTFAGSGGNFVVTWTEVGLRELLGFTGTLSGASTYTATNQHRYSWYPNTGAAVIAAHPNRRGLSSSDAVVRRAPSGRVITTAYDEYEDNEFEFRWIEDEYMFPIGDGSGAVVDNRSFEVFWRDVIRIGQRFRFYPDRTVQTAPSPLFGAPWEYIGGDKICSDGLTKVKQEQDNYSRYWRFVLDVMQYSAT